jgi:hypothetical protein
VTAADGALILQCLGVRRNGSPGGPTRATPSEWAEVLRQARDNGVVPLLYQRLTTAPPLVETPPAVLEDLRTLAMRSAAQSLHIVAELRVVLETLQRQGVAVIVLKGAHLGQLVYGSFALRTMCDLDVLVRREDLDRAAAALAGAGYTPQYDGVEAVDYLHHHHLRPMARPGGIKVEIHWTIAQPGAPFEVDLPGLWARARPADIAGVDVLVLAPEDLLIHLCLHASFGHRFRFGLRALWDIREVVRHYQADLDWDVVARRARELEIGRYMYLTLRLARELLAADLPAAAIEPLEPAGFRPEVLTWARTCVFTTETEAAVSPSMAKLWTARPLRTKLSVLGQTLFPSRTAMARIYGTRAASPWIYLYYAARGADLLLRYGRHAWRLWRGDDRTRDELRAVTERSAMREWLGCPMTGERV